MIERNCSFCDGRGTLYKPTEALEDLMTDLMKLYIERETPVICPKCYGTGVEHEIELSDLCRVAT